MDKVKKHTIRVRYVILSVIGFVLAVIIGIVTIALVSYKKQPKLTDGEKQELDNTDLLKRQTSPERAKIIEDNNDALKERIRMISQAKEEIILSTFDFRSDDSGKLILGALIDAADRGVSVNVIVDGVLKEYETYVDRMIEEEWLGSDEDGWEDEELPFD